MHNNQKIEPVQPPINKQVNKENMVHINMEVYVAIKKNKTQYLQENGYN